MNRSLTLAAAFVALLLVVAVGAYAYDSSREDMIAEGVTVGGVDIGGMSAPRARAEVQRRVEARVERPVAVTGRGKRFALSVEDARLHVDVGGMVGQAVTASRKGNLVTRVARDVTGGTTNEDIPVQVAYSKAAVEKLVARADRGLTRKARDARVTFPSLAKVKEQDGVQVRTAALQREVESALSRAGGSREVKAPTRVTEAKVTRDQLARKYPAVLVIERSAFQIKLYRNLEFTKSYKIAVGQVGLETPAGLYHIQNKGVNVPWNVPNKPWAGSLAGTTVPGGAPNNPLKARWMGIFAGAGIHGTDQLSSLGTAASHGCVRMAVPDVIALYPQVPVNSPVYIQ